VPSVLKGISTEPQQVVGDSLNIFVGAVFVKDKKNIIFSVDNKGDYNKLAS
jgi:hypothetical protein